MFSQLEMECPMNPGFIPFLHETRDEAMNICPSPRRRESRKFEERTGFPPARE
jgi:hypothetical protein